MNAYRYFHFVDVNNKPTPEFQKLVKSKNEERKAQIKMMLEIGYPEIMMHDLSTMTPKMLDEQLDKYNVSGDTKKKAATFFLQAAKFADVPLSSFLTERIRTTPNTRRRRKSENGEPEMRERFTPQSNTSGSTRVVSLSGGGTITLTVSVDVFSLGKEDREFVFGLIDQLQQYETDHPSQEDEQDDGQV
jgi:hypothetical protein